MDERRTTSASLLSESGQHARLAAARFSFFPLSLLRDTFSSSMAAVYDILSIHVLSAWNIFTSGSTLSRL